MSGTNNVELAEIDSHKKESFNETSARDEEENIQQTRKSVGVARIEKVKDSLDHSEKGPLFKALLWVSIIVCAWAVKLESATTGSYSTYATSEYNANSMISTLEIAIDIIQAVSKPMIAKISDVTSRPVSYLVVLFFYVLGYIIIAASNTIAAYVIGNVFVAIGSSGIALLNSIVAGDLTPLKYRGLISGALTFPYVINTWFSGLIVEDLVPDNWRWGYAMFAIIMPVVLSPAIATMLYLDRKANEVLDQTKEKRSFRKVLIDSLIEVDAFGLIIMGFGWSLLLLPFSLYKYADNEWKNPSIIAMIVVGIILLIVYGIYELKYAPFPSMPKRIITNKTFVSAMVTIFFYMLSNHLRVLYFSSITYVVKDWSVKNWTYWSNSLTVSLCFFGVVVGLIQRFTHRFKYLQITGICITIIFQGIIIRNHSIDISTAVLVVVSIFCGLGGACVVVGTEVSSQASVPHQDMSLAIALLSLWTSIGSAVGSAIAAPIWSAKTPYYLRKYLPDTVTDAQITKYYGSITLFRKLDFDSEIRQGAIKAYQHVAYYFFTSALGISFLTLIASLFSTNYYLGNTQNAVEVEKESDENETATEEEERKN